MGDVSVENYLDAFFDERRMRDASSHVFAFLGSRDGGDYLAQRHDAMAARARLGRWGPVHTELGCTLRGLGQAQAHLAHIRDIGENFVFTRGRRRFFAPTEWIRFCEETLEGFGFCEASARSRVLTLRRFIRLSVERPALLYALRARQEAPQWGGWFVGLALNWPHGMSRVEGTPFILDLRWRDGRWKTAVKYRMRAYLEGNGIHPKRSLTRDQLVGLCMAI